LSGRALALLLAAVALAACGRGAGEVPVTIRFAAQVGAEPFACGRVYSVGGAAVEPLDLRLFVHDLRLVRADGALVPIRLDDDGRFQTARVALLDFEDGTAGCRNGSPETRTVVSGHALPGEYVGIRFRIGVPFEDNHDNPDLAPSPLNLTAMEWSWNAGHTFLRFDVRANGKPIVFHTGSTGCQGTVGHVTGCARPNRAEVAIDGFSPAKNEVVFDLLPILSAGLSSGPNGTPGDGCMGAPDDPDCPALLGALGLDASTGLPVRPAPGFNSR
jgi:uncharacterized repeat protein (TIGR04052 family)